MVYANLRKLMLVKSKKGYKYDTRGPNKGKIIIFEGLINIFETLQIKKVELLPPFLPQIYHKLNLLMLW